MLLVRVWRGVKRRLAAAKSMLLFLEWRPGVGGGPTTAHQVKPLL
jgi:hypothetical protein